MRFFKSRTRFKGIASVSRMKLVYLLVLSKFCFWFRLSRDHCGFSNYTFYSSSICLSSGLDQQSYLFKKSPQTLDPQQRAQLFGRASPPQPQRTQRVHESEEQKLAHRLQQRL